MAMFPYRADAYVGPLSSLIHSILQDIKILNIETVIRQMKLVIIKFTLRGATAATQSRAGINIESKDLIKIASEHIADSRSNGLLSNSSN